MVVACGWLSPRWDYDRPGPLPLETGETIAVGGSPATVLAAHPGLPRLRFIQLGEQAQRLLHRCGEPIRYGYVRNPYPLAAYQTIFARVPGSAEMPSAGRPFTRRVLHSLKQRGVEVASVLLHTGVSSLEVETDRLEEHPMYAEPFAVPAAAADAVNRARGDGRRVIAVGTTVVRALESAWAGGEVRPVARLYAHFYPPPTGCVHGRRLDQRFPRSFSQPPGHALRRRRAGVDPRCLHTSDRKRLPLARVWRQPSNIARRCPCLIFACGCISRFWQAPPGGTHLQEVPTSWHTDRPRVPGSPHATLPACSLVGRASHGCHLYSLPKSRPTSPYGNA